MPSNGRWDIIRRLKVKSSLLKSWQVLPHMLSYLLLQMPIKF